MMKKILAICPASLLILLALLGHIQSLSAQQSFEHTYRNGPIISRQLFQASDEGFVLKTAAGYCDTSFVIKTDPNGYIQWSHSYDHTIQFDPPRSIHIPYKYIEPNPDDSFTLFGEYEAAFDSIFFCAMGLDQHGVPQWEKAHRFLLDDSVTEVHITDPDGVIRDQNENFVIIGELHTLDTLIQSVSVYGFIVQLDPNGNLNWAHVFDWESAPMERGTDFTSIVQHPNGDYYVVGHHFSRSVPAVLFRIDPNGSRVWSKKIENYDGFDFHLLYVNQQGELVLLGTEDWPGVNVAMLVMDEQGTPLWRRKYLIPGPTGSNDLIDMFQTNTNGDYFLLLNYDRLARIQSNGTLLSVHGFSGYTSSGQWSSIYASDMIHCSDQTPAIFAQGSVGNTPQTWLIKTDATGWTPCDPPVESFLALDAPAFQMTNLPAEMKIVEAKEDEIISEPHAKSIVEYEYCSGHGERTGAEPSFATDASPLLFPNPSSGTCTIDLSAWTDQESLIRVYDLQGRLVAQQQVGTGILQHKIHLTTPAVYLVQVKSGQKTWEEKLIVR